MVDNQSNLQVDEKRQFKIFLTVFGTFVFVVVYSGLLVTIDNHLSLTFDPLEPNKQAFIFGFLPGAVGLTAIWYRILNKNVVPAYVRWLSWAPLLYIPIYLVMFMIFLSALATI